MYAIGFHFQISCCLVRMQRYTLFFRLHLQSAPFESSTPEALFLLIVLQLEFSALNHKDFVVGIYGISLEFRTFPNKLAT